MVTATKKTATPSKASTATAKKTTKPVAAKTSDQSGTTKKVASKAAAPKSTLKKTAPAKSAKTKATTEPQQLTVSPEHRYHMIATAAYYLAQKRGFSTGYEMHDWITAEAEIDAKLKS